jgi:SAM-dependent methyltransferase
MDSGFSDHFSAVSAGYARFRPRYPQALFDYLAGLAPAHELAWDCATGSGQAAVSLASRFRRVVATDASESQITHADPRPNIEYRVARAEGSGLADVSVDLITVAQALHWFDQVGFFAEARRVLRPGGVLAVWSYARCRVGDAALEALLEHFHDHVVGPFWPPERRILETGYPALSSPFEELQPPGFELTADWSLEDMAGYLRTWSASQAYIREKGDDPVGPLCARLETAGWTQGEIRRIAWPLSMRVGRIGEA